MSDRPLQIALQITNKNVFFVHFRIAEDIYYNTISKLKCQI